MADIPQTLRIIFGSAIFLVTVILFVSTGISLQNRLSNASVMAQVTFVGKRCALACDAAVSGTREPYECDTAGPYPELVKGGYCVEIPKRYFEARYNEHSVWTEIISSAATEPQVGDKTRLLMSDNGLLRRPSPLQIPLLALASIAALGLLLRFYRKPI